MDSQTRKMSLAEIIVDHGRRDSGQESEGWVSEDLVVEAAVEHWPETNVAARRLDMP